MKITEIPAKPKEQKTIRVAAYARVSSDKDTAFHSLEAQTEYYEDYVAAHSDWELAGIYSDNAISGTTINRLEFQRMLGDCRSGRIDLIITKSITRFARNTVDLLRTTRELKDLGIDCYFEKENMHSISPDGEFFLTLLAMYAEEEARSVSENQKWKIKRKFELGEPWVGNMLGYRLIDGKMVIVPEEAEIVRKIFSDYLSGSSILSITKALNRLEIPAARSAVWNHTTVSRILRNEKYTGNMILQKTYCEDFRTKRQVINHGEVRKYEVSNSHEAIISESDFLKVQEKLEKNRQNNTVTNSKSHYIFTGLLLCGLCGSAYVRRISNTGKYRHYVWTCRRYDQLGKEICSAKPIPESILIQTAKDVLDLDEIDNNSLRERLVHISVPCHHKLIFQYKDGMVKEVEWKHKSRSLSWTPEMRQQARERALSQRRKEKTKHE